VEEGLEHWFEHRLFAEAIGDKQPPTLLDKQPFEQVRRPRNAPMRDGQMQESDARFEIVREMDQVARPRRCSQLSVHQSAKRLARTFGRGYSRRRDARRRAVRDP